MGSEDLSPRENRIRAAHGIIMAIVFLFMKPGGAILFRVLKTKASLRIHIVLQMFAFTVAIAGVTLGIYTASFMDRFGKQHVIIGFVVLGGMLIQPWLGWWHHVLYRQKGRRTWIGVAHQWVGRIAILLGIINGGIGLGDANNSLGCLIAYTVLAPVCFCAYVVILVILHYQKGRTTA